MGLFRKKRVAPIPYDPKTQQPAVRRSICTGEMTVGFLQNGVFKDFALARDQQELEEFCDAVGVSPAELKTVY